MSGFRVHPFASGKQASACSTRERADASPSVDGRLRDIGANVVNSALPWRVYRKSSQRKSDNNAHHGWQRRVIGHRSVDAGWLLVTSRSRHCGRHNFPDEHDLPVFGKHGLSDRYILEHPQLPGGNRASRRCSP